MSVIAWIVLGLISGFIASRIVNERGEATAWDIVLGIVGAVVGGFLFDLLGAVGTADSNISSMVIAVIGAAVVLATKHTLIRSRRARV